MYKQSSSICRYEFICELLICIKLILNSYLDALEIVKQDPLIKEIYIATINMDLGEPLFIIWAYTKSGIPPYKQFRFKLNPSGEIRQI